MSGQAVSPLNGQQDESIPEDMVIDTVQDRNQQVPGTDTQHPAPPTQNILGDYGKQANNSGTGTQQRARFTFSRTTLAPAPAPMPTTAPALAHTSGTQSIHGNYGEQANNSGNQDDARFDLAGQQDESIPEDMVIDPNSLKTPQVPGTGTQHPAPAPAPKSPSKPDINQQVPGTGTQHPAPPTQNILGDYGKQADRSGTQQRPRFTFSRTTPAPAPAPMPTTAPAPAPALAHTSGTQNIQGNYGEQANNSSNQDDATFDLAGQGTQTPANSSGT